MRNLRDLNHVCCSPAADQVDSPRWKQKKPVANVTLALRLSKYKATRSRYRGAFVRQPLATSFEWPNANVMVLCFLGSNPKASSGSHLPRGTIKNSLVPNRRSFRPLRFAGRDQTCVCRFRNKHWRDIDCYLSAGMFKLYVNMCLCFDWHNANGPFPTRFYCFHRG